MMPNMMNKPIDLDSINPLKRAAILAGAFCAHSGGGHKAIDGIAVMRILSFLHTGEFKDLDPRDRVAAAGHAFDLFAASLRAEMT